MNSHMHDDRQQVQTDDRMSLWLRDDREVLDGHQRPVADAAQN